MRYFLVMICIWSSVSVFTYTEIFVSSKHQHISPQIEQLLENYIDSLIDETFL